MGERAIADGADAATTALVKQDRLGEWKESNLRSRK